LVWFDLGLALFGFAWFRLIQFYFLLISSVSLV